jgi:hypothetical protein
MKTSINLIPVEHRRWHLIRRRLWQWSLFWALCLVAVGVNGYRKSERCRQDRQALDSARQRYLPLQELTDATQAMRCELQNLQARETLVGQLREKRSVFTLLGLASRSAAKSDGRLYLSRLQFERENTAEQNRTSGKKPSDADQTQDPADTLWARVTFAGEARDNLAVATFAAALRDSGLFRRVELKSSIENAGPEPLMRTFSLICEI